MWYFIIRKKKYWNNKTIQAFFFASSSSSRPEVDIFWRKKKRVVINNNNIYNYWDKNLIDKVAASIYYVEDDIEFNYNDLYETCNKLSKINNVKIKKLIIFNISLYNSYKFKIIVDNKFFKVVDINLISFLKNISLKLLDVNEIIKKKSYLFLR